MPAMILPIPVKQFFTDGNVVLNGGLLYTYSPGTTTDKDTYTDAAKSATHTNPIVLDAYGRYPDPVYWDGLYDVVLKTSGGTTIETISDFGETWSAVGTDLNENPLSNHSFETAGTGSEPVANWTQSKTTTISRTTAVNQHGTAAILFTGTSEGDTLTSDLFEIAGGETANIEFYTYASNAAAEPSLYIRWYDEDQVYLSESKVYHDNEGVTPTSWTLKQGSQASAPANARYSAIKLVGNSSITSYTTYFDDIDVSFINEFSEISPYIPYGLTISRDAGDTSHDLNVTKGSVKSDDFANDMVHAAEMTKQMDVAWAVGDDAGGWDGTGALPASGNIAVWLIKSSTTGRVDILGSLSYTAPTMPSGYDIKRYIGSWITDASNNLIDGVHKFDEWWWYAETNEVSDTSDPDTGVFTTSAMEAPPNCKFYYSMNVEMGNNTTETRVQLRVRNPDSDYSYGFGSEIASANTDEIWCEGEVFLDSSSQLEYAIVYDTANTIVTIKINNRGWVDLLRNAP